MNALKIKTKFIVLVLMMGCVMSISYMLQQKSEFAVESVQSMIQGAGVWAPLWLIIIYMLTSLIAFPSSILSIASGFVWGPWLGTVYTVIAASLASVLPFYLTRMLGRDFILKMTKQSLLGKCDQFISKHGFISIVLVRLIPLFPWDIVNFGAGLCGFKFRQYILATLIGIIPGSLLYNSIGAGVGKSFAPTRLILIALVFFLSMGIPFIYQKIKVRKEKPESVLNTSEESRR